MFKRLLLALLVSTSSTSATAQKPALALVIDDLGYSFDLAKQVLDLPGNHSFAVIPDTTYSAKIARYANQQGHEIILHMPMQSSEDVSIEASALNDKMTELEITQNVSNMLSEVPHIKGINNHMGSKLTQFGYIMRPVMETIRQTSKKLYFLDSRTTPLSTAYRQALKAGLPTVKRDVFLDFDHTNRESINFQIDLWMKKAQKKGYAVAIAHPHPSTIDLLKNKIPQSQNDFQFVTISQLLQRQTQQKQESFTWPKYLSHLHPDLKN